MTIREARMILQEYYENTNPSEEDEFLYTEALKYLIEETKDPDRMVELGGYYYEHRNFDLALKYYELAAEYNNLYAISNLGYIWYYGRTGERNYEKAFYYFDRARQMGDLIAAYKVADMYKNGYYVEQDREKYKSIIEELYPKVKNARRLNEPLPEIFTRLAKIRSEEGDTKEALRLYDFARDFLAQRIQAHPFFGDLSIMKWMITDIYKLRPFDPEFIDLYDLYYLLTAPVKVRFTYEGETHEVEAALETEGEPLAVRFDDKWFRTVDDFFQKAELDDELLTSCYEELFDFEVQDGTDQKQ
jgi:tetratricopeptide (TPR) repeat protein